MHKKYINTVLTSSADYELGNKIHNEVKYDVKNTLKAA